MYLCACDMDVFMMFINVCEVCVCMCNGYEGV